MAGPLSYNGAAFLFSGLSQAGQSLGGGIGQGLGRFFDEKALKKLVDDLRKSMGGNAPGAIVPNNGDPQMFIPPIEGFQSGGYTGPGAPNEPAGIVHRNEYVVPSDQVQDAGGPQMIEALLSGLSQNPRAASAPGFAGIANLAQMWEKRKEEEKAIGTTGKALKQIFKSNPDLLQGAGLMPEQLENLGHRDVIGLFEGMQQAQAMQAKAAGMKELAARLLQQQQEAEMKAAISRDFAQFATSLPNAEATAPELGEYYDSTSTEMPNRPNVLPQATGRLGSRYPLAMQHNNFNDYVKLLEPPARRGTAIPGSLLPVPGRPDLSFGVQSESGAGTFLTMPKGQAQEGEPTEVMMGGQSTGWAKFPDGSYKRLPKKEDKMDFGQYDADGDGVLSNAEFVNAMMAQKMGGAYPGMKVPKGDAAPLALPESKEELKTGQVYQTARGKARWDGDKFNPVP